VEAGWQRFADIPGSPRAFTSGGAVGGKIYAFGGIHIAPRKPDRAVVLHNVVDSWVYDPSRAQWSRLPDVPHGANRRVVSFKDRYLIMLGGYRYGTTWRVDGTVSDALGARERAMPEIKDHIDTTVLVFDTRTKRIGTASPLIDRTSWPMAAIRGDTIYCLGGEGGHRMWHPATMQIGKVEETAAKE
jgi:N-acetylneuraminic acid mutarotase